MQHVPRSFGLCRLLLILAVTGLTRPVFAEETRAPPAQSTPFDATPARGDAPVAQTSTPPPPENDSNNESSDGLFGPIRLGPMLGVGLPDLLNIGGLVKFTRYLGAGVNMGIIPTVRVSYYGEATLSFQEYDIFGRIHPFGGGFFLGAGVGYATVKGTMKDTFDTTPYASLVPANLSIPNTLTYQSQGSVKTLVLTPQVGYFYTTDIGFSIGFDIGAQVPIAPSKINFNSQLALPAATPPQIVNEVRTQLIDPNDQKVRDSLQTIGRTPLPTINFRIGWLL